MRRVKTLGLLVGFFLFSCQKEEKKPDYLWSEEEFAELLTEVQMAEAFIRLGMHREVTKDSIVHNDSIYASVFRKWEISRQDFDSNYHYYLNHPKKFEAIYEKVITNLSERSASIQRKGEKEKKMKKDSSVKNEEKNVKLEADEKE